MINFEQANKFCKEDLSLIENYEQALNSDEMYDCHHRNGIILNKSAEELQSIGLYFDRPASELIFLTHSEHARLHGINRSEETKQKMSEAHKGHKHSEETRQKQSEALKGRTAWNKGMQTPEETKQKISNKMTGENHPMYGKHWKLVDGKRVYY